MLSFFKSILGMFAKISSVLVGIPVGAGMAIFFATCYAIAFAVDGAAAFFLQKFGSGQTVKKENPLTEAIKDFFGKATGASLYFMVSGEISVLKAAFKKSGENLANKGHDPDNTINTQEIHQLKKGQSHTVPDAIIDEERRAKLGGINPTSVSRLNETSRTR